MLNSLFALAVAGPGSLWAKPRLALTCVVKTARPHFFSFFSGSPEAPQAAKGRLDVFPDWRAGKTGKKRGKNARSFQGAGTPPGLRARSERTPGAKAPALADARTRIRGTLPGGAKVGMKGHTRALRLAGLRRRALTMPS